MADTVKHAPTNLLDEVDHILGRALEERLSSEGHATEDLIGYVMRYGGMCRDCADLDGVCQSGQPCDTDQRRAVVEHTISALAYGIKNGFIANPFAVPSQPEGRS